MMFEDDRTTVLNSGLKYVKAGSETSCMDQSRIDPSLVRKMEVTALLFHRIFASENILQNLYTTAFSSMQHEPAQTPEMMPKPCMQNSKDQNAIKHTDLLLPKLIYQM
jgi:hypothetical protein